MPAITPMDGSMWKVSGYLAETDPKKVAEYLRGILEQSGFTIFGDIDHHFDPQGYTSLTLLGESHLAVHTFPEFGNSYFELSSCMESKYQKFRDLLAEKSAQGVNIVSEESVSPPKP